MRIVQISDVHLFADTEADLLGLNTAKSFEAVVNLVKQQQSSPDMIILSGDIAQDYSTEAYSHVAKMMQIFTCPIYWFAGNHDVPDVMQKVFSTTHLKDDKAILLGDWLIVLLNSHFPKHVAGQLGRSELSRLDYYLTQHPTKHALVFLHHHPIMVGSKWLDISGLQNPDDFFAVIDSHPQVRSIFCGHVHQVFETQRQGVSIISAPSTCIQFLPGSQEFALDSLAPGYRWIDLQPDGVFHTDVERVPHFVNTVDFSAKGY
jgi:3',5'-cyclic-AMP phosphodiesterase